MPGNIKKCQSLHKVSRESFVPSKNNAAEPDYQIRLQYTCADPDLKNHAGCVSAEHAGPDEIDICASLIDHILPVRCIYSIICRSILVAGN
jgi:hypothetical protein